MLLIADEVQSGMGMSGKVVSLICASRLLSRVLDVGLPVLRHCARHCHLRQESAGVRPYGHVYVVYAHACIANFC